MQSFLAHATMANRIAWWRFTPPGLVHCVELPRAPGEAGKGLQTYLSPAALCGWNVGRRILIFGSKPVQLVEPYLPMRTDIEKWAYAALFSEIILEMVPAGEPHPGPFLLHKKTLDRLEWDKDPQNVLLLALLRFQFLMGYMPAMDECAVCRRRLKTSKQWFWQAAQGKLVCAGSLLFEYQVYCPGYGDIGVNTIFEENSTREDLAASDAPGDESTPFEGPSRLVRLSYRKTNPEH